MTSTKWYIVIVIYYYVLLLLYSAKDIGCPTHTQHTHIYTHTKHTHKHTQMAHLFMRELPDHIGHKVYRPVLAEQPFPLGTRAVYFKE